jgi:hypothetical protein
MVRRIMQVGRKRPRQTIPSPAWFFFISKRSFTSTPNAFVGSTSCCSSSSSSSSTSTISVLEGNNEDRTPLKEIAVPLRTPNRCSNDIHSDWLIDESKDGLVGAGAFAEVRLARPTINNNTSGGKKVVVKSFYQDTKIYFDSLNRELAALDELSHVNGVHNYMTAYGHAFFTDDEGEEEDKEELLSSKALSSSPFDSSSQNELHIVSEFIPYGDLFDFIMNSSNGQVDPMNVLNIGKQLVDTLNDVHKQGRLLLLLLLLLLLYIFL